MICKKCGCELTDGDIFCPGCGEKTENNAPQFCEACGKRLKDGAVFCSFCGTKVGEGFPLFCGNCGGKRVPGAERCQCCSIRLPEAQPLHCRKCGNEMPLGAAACPICGALAAKQPPIVRAQEKSAKTCLGMGIVSIIAASVFLLYRLYFLARRLNIFPGSEIPYRIRSWSIYILFIGVFGLVASLISLRGYRRIDEEILEEKEKENRKIGGILAKVSLGLLFGGAALLMVPF